MARMGKARGLLTALGMAALVLLIGGCRTLNGDQPPLPSAGPPAYGRSPAAYGGGQYVQIDSDTVCDYAARACYKWSGQRQRYKPDLNKTEAIFGPRAARAAAKRWGWSPPDAAPPARPAPPPPIAFMPPPPVAAPPMPPGLAQPPMPPQSPGAQLAQPPTPPTGVAAPPQPPAAQLVQPTPRRAARGDAAVRRNELQKRRQAERSEQSMSGQSMSGPSTAGDAAAGEP